VAAPGCYATASILALAPLLAAGLADPADIVIVAASGTSGAGRSLRSGLLATEVMGSMSAYQVGGVHRHTPEIEQNIDPERAGLPAPAPVSVSFTPTLAPMPRGILATCTARLREPAAASSGAGRLRDALRAAYDSEPFVHVLPEDRWPATLGFRAAGVAAGLKQSGQPDVAVVLNDGPARSAAAVFTSNRVQAAPVTWTRQVVSGGRVRAVVLNSGGANACTGPAGFQDT